MNLRAFYTRSQAQKLSARVSNETTDVDFVWIWKSKHQSKLNQLKEKGCEKLFSPLYPQYAAATTATLR